MEWYRPTISRTAAKPPAYLVERISDLQHACTLAKTSPSEANLVIAQTISKLSGHHDDLFVPPLKAAMGIMLDSPVRGKEAVIKVIEAMIIEKEMKEAAEEDEKWTRRR